MSAITTTGLGKLPSTARRVASRRFCPGACIALLVGPHGMATRQAWRLIPCCETHEKFRDSPNLDSECLIHFSRKGRKTFTAIYYAFLVLQENDSGVAQNAVRKGALLTTFTPLTSALAVKVSLSSTFPGRFLSGECFWKSPNLLSGQTLRKVLR